jgi:hypothetical protein
MRRRFVLRPAAAALAVWAAGAAAAPGSGTLAGFDGTVRETRRVPETRRRLETDLRTEAFRLWEKGGFGLDRSERAAWVVALPGGLGWRPWPWDRRYLQSRWLGATPAGAVAIVHTHPEIVDPRPSQTDFATAARLGIPVYTVSRSGIWKAEPDGGVARIGDEHWWDGCEARKPCRESVSVPFALASRESGTGNETTEQTLRITE